MPINLPDRRQPEAGFIGFWVHRFQDAHGVESHLPDAASIAVNRGNRRAMTDRLDAENLPGASVDGARSATRWLNGMATEPGS